MTNPRSQHLRKLKTHSLNHNHHHTKLKHVLSHDVDREKRYWVAVLIVLTLVGIGWFLSYKISLQGAFGPQEVRPAAPNLYTNGYQQGVETAQALGSGKEDLLNETSAEGIDLSTQRLEGLANSLVTATNLSKTGGAKTVDTQLLQKTILTAYQLGTTTNKLETALANDTQVLNEIENVLSVELDKFLNQSVNRADALDNHLNLLSILNQKATTRQNELTTTINFLEKNINAQEQVLNVSEDQFFGQLDQAIQPNLETSFQSNKSEGEVLQEELDEFIALQQRQAEDKAKKGAYESLRGYYDFYLPTLQLRAEAIQANRDALIAGVKVVDMPGVDLGLIIQE